MLPYAIEASYIYFSEFSFPLSYNSPYIQWVLYFISNLYFNSIDLASYALYFLPRIPPFQDLLMNIIPF